jgi:phosphatidylinositol-bisphosphatase
MRDLTRTQDIAMGVTPIAARESVVKYQMSMKEDQFTEIQHFVIYAATWNVNGQVPISRILNFGGKVFRQIL